MILVTFGGFCYIITLMMYARFPDSEAEPARKELVDTKCYFILSSELFCNVWENAPQEVSELLIRITVLGKKNVNKVHDPACGSGSLFLKFAKVLGKEHYAAVVVNNRIAQNDR